MELFKPIWKSKNKGRISSFIDNAHDLNPWEQEKLSGIALYCSFSDLRIAAAKKIWSSDVRVSTMMTAKKNGDLETVQAIIDKHSSSICNSDLFSPVVKSGDMELLSLLAMRVRSFNEWNTRHDEFEPLLNTSGFTEAKEHYAELKKIDVAEKREVTRLKRKENEKKKHDAFLRDPKEQLIKASGKSSEKKLWREWYDYQFSIAPGGIFSRVIHELNELDWSIFFPVEYLERVVLESSNAYASEGRFNSETATLDLKFFLRTLYEKREEMQEGIISLNSRIYFAGTDASSVNFGDHHEDWFITFDPIPAYRLSFFFIDGELQIQLEEVAKA